MNAREGIKTFSQDQLREETARLKTMNAREGIKTTSCAMSAILSISLKTMNAREGIKTHRGRHKLPAPLLVKNNECP